MKMYAPKRRTDDMKKPSKTKRALITASTTVAVIVIPAVDALAKLPGPKRW
jgi:hypothetical protein